MEQRRARMLSKSDFKLARTCKTKLFFRENHYPDSSGANPYLQLLAEGGYMVEALAKARYADGIQLSYGRNVHLEFEEFLEALKQENVTLFEATLVSGRRQARVDILQKKGKRVRLLEVKAKSFDGVGHAEALANGRLGGFRGAKKPFPIRSEWREKLEDIAFQVVALERLLPDCEIHPFLVLVDTSKRAEIDDLPRLFTLEWHTVADGSARVQGAKFLGTAADLRSIDLLTEVDVSAEVALLRDEVDGAALELEALLDAPFSTYAEALERGAHCTGCEFRHLDERVRSGFRQCWGALAEPRPHLLELFSVGKVRTPQKEPLVEWMIDQGKASLLDVPEEYLAKADGSVGPIATRQRRQIEYTRRGEVFVGRELPGKVEALRRSGLLHFIDFETSRLALPYHRGMRPYGLATFQWSCHTLERLGGEPRHREWLNDEDVWPNQSFAESLRGAVGDTGTVITWSKFEETTLKHIIEDLHAFGRNVPELVGWMRELFESRMVDLHEWARSDYYHPGMRGRTSIKVVLEALWRTDAQVRERFEKWTGYRADASRDPYALLPPVEIGGVMQEVHEGTGAMRAYQEMMYGGNKDDRAIRTKWASLLKQYCALDTLSMVLVLEHWSRLAMPSAASV